MKNSNKGFTLAEVLVTLAIIGVVAALTIPTLIQSTNSSKFTTALKKNLSTLNQVIQTNLANNDMDAADTSIVDATDLTAWFVTGDATGIAGTTAPTNLNVLRWAAADPTSVWLNDGTRLTFFKTTGTTGGCATDNANDFTIATAETCYVMVDTNGDRKPNQVAIDASQNAADVWILGILPGSVVPVILDGASATLPTTNVNGGVLSPAYTNASGTHVVLDNNSASYNALTGGT